MKITLLGTGTSQGVPVIACECEVCLSKDTKDKRLRSSIMIEVDGINLVVDTGPDFRQQMLTHNVKKVDAILFTHEHIDHVGGLDDVRSFNYKWKCDMPIYCSSNVLSALKHQFSYIFSNSKYPGVPKIDVNIISNETFKISSTKIIPISAIHYKLPVFGFRIKDFIYLTDLSFISEKEKLKMVNAKVIVLDSLRKKPHMSHLCLQESIDLLLELKPKKAYLTHISHFMGLHLDVNKDIPDFIQLGYDGQVINI